MLRIARISWTIGRRGVDRWGRGRSGLQRLRAGLYRRPDSGTGVVPGRRDGRVGDRREVGCFSQKQLLDAATAANQASRASHPIPTLICPRFRGRYFVLVSNLRSLWTGYSSLRRAAQKQQLRLSAGPSDPIHKSRVQLNHRRRLCDAGSEAGTGVIMLENNLKSISLNEASASSAGSGNATSAERNGRVKHDSRGNAVWDWGVATGIFAGIKSTELLSMLDNPTLSLEGDSGYAKTGDWAGDPYNRR
jgi:hypothetical protein